MALKERRPELTEMPRQTRRETDDSDTEAADDAGQPAAASTAKIVQLVNAAQESPHDPHRYLLLARFGLINLIAFALLGAAYVHGFIDSVLAADPTRLVVVIFVVFVAGLVMSGWKIVQTSRELNKIKGFDPNVKSRAAQYLMQIEGRDGAGRLIAASMLRLKLSNRIGAVRTITNSLVFLGLIGTVIGFIIALSGVDPTTASDVNSIAPMVAKLIQGISVALYTTLVGAVLSLWLTANFQVLAAGTVNLIAAITELGESHGRP